jgi:hypothetical protein
MQNLIKSIVIRFCSFNNQCNTLSYASNPALLPVDESEKNVLTERNRQRNVSISEPPPRHSGRAGGPLGGRAKKV